MARKGAGSIQQQMEQAILDIVDSGGRQRRLQWLDLCHSALQKIPECVFNAPDGNPLLVVGRRPLKVADLLLQNHANKMGDIATGYMLAQFWTALHSGLISFTSVYSGSIPSQDSARVPNQQALDDLPKPFRATVWQAQNCEQDDGVLEWDGCLSRLTPYRNSAPLEIGSCDIETIFRHIHYEACVARWPYGVDWILLLSRTQLGDTSRFWSNICDDFANEVTPDPDPVAEIMQLTLF